ncbi:HAD family hydrolase [Flavivirga sp. 57AJ16]|uniref:HAD family hydrolase n=1 Tax=Flavivirga sp. 57AJ16 TaxID=3025307 RepID=UPI002366DC74|nr:HAD family hydrolase [Flavivirga sp. 57AJ16]MDD7887611.1 HAD family hydrolase [Flavivirga sp. 57AJ16]
MTIKTNKVIVFDLDDTLYNEIDFLKSAFNEIASQIVSNSDVEKTVVYHDMLQLYHAKLNVFEVILEKYHCSFQLHELLDIYRSHQPNIVLKQENLDVLKYLKLKGVNMGIITDGRSIQQRNKIKALNLDAFISEIMVSEEFGSEKPNIKNYEYFEKTFGEGEYYYIGDNLKKDFISPNMLGWTTICLLNKGLNIHEQNFDLPGEYLPKYKIKDLTQILKLVDV